MSQPDNKDKSRQNKIWEVLAKRKCGYEQRLEDAVRYYMQQVLDVHPDDAT